MSTNKTSAAAAAALFEGFDRGDEEIRSKVFVAVPSVSRHAGRKDAGRRPMGAVSHRSAAADGAMARLLVDFVHRG